MHYLSQLSGGMQIAVVSHSQGGPNTQWALQFWPSTRNVTRAFVAISPDFAGIDLLGSSSLLNDICADGLCQASLWQQSAGSKYYQALHNQDFKALVPTTSIWTQVTFARLPSIKNASLTLTSQFDGVVVPPQNNAQLPGATVVSVQSLCPLRPDTHVTMTISAASYALALDALNNKGVASLSRVRKSIFSTCLRVTAKGMNPDLSTNIKELLENLVKGFL